MDRVRVGKARPLLSSFTAEASLAERPSVHSPLEDRSHLVTLWSKIARRDALPVVI